MWLPDAHVEASTEGSVILAGIVLKLGLYGILRFLYPLFPLVTVYYKPLLCIISFISIYHSVLLSMRQVDLKKILAYLSITHMSFALLGLCSFSYESFSGAILLLFSHGVITSALFISVGFLQDRYQTRNIIYYRSLKNFMPIYTILILILALSNAGIPLTSTFISEILIFTGVNLYYFEYISVLLLYFLLNLVCAIVILTRITYGNLSSQYLTYYVDLSRREYSVLISLITIIIVLGIIPSSFILNFIIPVINTSLLPLLQ